MNPQYVSTNNARLTPGGLVETSEAFANATMSAVGKTNMSCGTWKHIVFGFVFKQIYSTLSRTNWHQYLNESIIKKKANAMWEKRV